MNTAAGMLPIEVRILEHSDQILKLCYTNRNPCVYFQLK